jgi:hypothetical protein
VFDGDFGMYLVCEEFDFDGGDCDGDNNSGGNKEYYHVNIPNQTREEFVGYNLYRSLESGGTYTIITSLTGQVTSYQDADVQNGTMYYYVVTSQFTETESAYSNEAGAAPMGAVSITLDASSGPYDQGDTFEVSVSMNNPYPVAGVELHLQDTPESVSMIDVQGAGVISGVGTISQSEVNGETIVLWFDFTGEVIEPQDGEILTITYQVNDDAPDGETVELGLTNMSAFSDSQGNAYFWNSNTVEFVTGLPDALP